MKQRELYMDMLRLCAIFGVVICHVQGQYEFKLDVTSCEWQIMNFYNCIVRGSLGVLVMISGALFLEKKPAVEKIYKKNIIRIVTAFLVWSSCYAFIDATPNNSGAKELVVDIISGHVHLWYLYMLVGLYIVTPLLYKIVESKILTKYFLGLSFVFLFCVPQGISLISQMSDGLGEALSVARENANINFVMGYVFYYILGYYLNMIKITKRMEWIVYFAGAAGFIATIVGTQYLSVAAGQPVVILQTAFTINVMLQAVAVFVLFKQHVRCAEAGQTGQRIVTRLSKYSFGVYLVHILVLDQLFVPLGLDAMRFHPLLAVPIVSAGIFVVSMVISGVLNQIPLLKKYIV